MKLKQLYIFFLLSVVASCSNTAKNTGQSSRKKEVTCGAKGQKPCPQASAETPIGSAEPAPPQLPDGMMTGDGGLNFLKDSISSFYLSGNGPGSCYNNPSCAAAPCESDSIPVPNAAMGDCPQNPGARGPCFGNRFFCSKKGLINNDRVMVGLHVTAGVGCPAGLEGSGPVDGTLHPVFGYSISNTWGAGTFCRQTIAVSQVVPGTTELIKDIYLTHPGARKPEPDACKAGYRDIGKIHDCLHAAGITPSGAPVCSGAVRICVQYQVIPKA